MSRKSVKRSLPPLKQLFPEFRGCPRDEHHLHLAVDYLRSAARQLRKGKNVAFYSMREACVFLKVPLRTVALAYQQLESEGWIIRIRSSRTVLLGKVIRSQHPGRAIVSVPVPLHAITSSFFTRNFCYRIGEELWRHQFVANLILCTRAELQSTEFIHRLQKQSDMIIWLLPDRNLKETIILVHDYGVQNVLLCPVEDQFLTPNYIMDWTPTYRKAIRAWKKDGIDHVLVARPVRPEAPPVIENFLHLLRSENCTFTLVDATARELLKKTELILRQNKYTACAILEHELTHTLCNREPDIMAHLTTLCRVFFARGVVHVPHFFKKDIHADVAGFLGGEVAVEIAYHLGHRNSKDTVPLHLFPKWMPQANLGEIFI